MNKAGAVGGSLIGVAMAMVFMPKIHEVNNRLSDTHLTDLRYAQLLFILFALGTGVATSVASKTTVPFVASAFGVFVVMAAYESKVMGYEI